MPDEKPGFPFGSFDFKVADGSETKWIGGSITTSNRDQVMAVIDYMRSQIAAAN